MKLEITPTEAKILRVALVHESEVRYDDTEENHLKYHKEIDVLLDKICTELRFIENN